MSRAILSRLIGALLIVSVEMQDGQASEPTDTQWGKATNGLQCGILLDPKLLGDSVFFPMIQNIGTNYVLMWLPEEYECIRISLIARDGKEVPRTRKGQQIGKPLKTEFKLGLSKRENISLPPGASGPYLVKKNLRDFFRIPSSGRYLLKIQLCGYIFDESHQAHAVVLPPAATLIDILPE